MMISITIDPAIPEDVERLGDLYDQLSKKNRELKMVAVRDLALSNRTYRCLEAEGVHTVEDLIAMSAVDLLKTPNIGRKSITEITDELARRGLSLAGIKYA